MVIMSQYAQKLAGQKTSESEFKFVLSSKWNLVLNLTGLKSRCD